MQATKQTTIPTIDIFEIYFFSPEREGTLFDSVFAKALVDYSRMFCFSGEVVHCAVRLGEYIYEVTIDGTVKYPWTPEFIKNSRIVALYTADISKVDLSKSVAARFALDNMLGRKLDVKGSLRYLWQAVGFHKSIAEIDMMMFTSYVANLSLPSGNYRRGNKDTFNLPFTCTAPATAALRFIFGLEPCFTNHIAQSIGHTMIILAERGIGEIMFTNEEGYLDV